MRLIIISGRSGSGKTTCLHLLEDLGYYCVDNIPASLLDSLATRLSDPSLQLDKVGVSIDARNLSEDLKQFPQIYARLGTKAISGRIIFLDADDTTLLKRFSETRRKHPLSNDRLGLMEAIAVEKELLEPISTLADLTVNTNSMSIHQLRDIIKNRVAENDNDNLALQFQSFGFKHGVPVDADMVYDARCLSNPYWIAELSDRTGLEQPVIDYLESQPEVAKCSTTSAPSWNAGCPASGPTTAATSPWQSAAPAASTAPSTCVKNWSGTSMPAGIMHRFATRNLPEPQDRISNP